MEKESIQPLIAQLHAGPYACVVRQSSGHIVIGTEKGIRDLLRLVSQPDAPLRGSMVADKVVGKAAASLMAVGGVVEVYADLLSEAGASTLRSASIRYSYGQLVPHILRPDLQSLCPMEALTLSADTPDEAVSRIRERIANIKNNPQTSQTT